MYFDSYDMPGVVFTSSAATVPSSATMKVERERLAAWLFPGESGPGSHVIPCYTDLRVIGWAARGRIVVANLNITLSLPEEDIREARILAASRGTSVSQLLARMLKELVEQETGYASARDRSLARLREGMDLGTGGHIGWSRDSVHDR